MALPESVVITPMRWWHLEAVAALDSELFVTNWSIEQFVSELVHAPKTRWYVVALRDDALVGYAGLRAVPPDGDVQTIGVARALQGQGLGAHLLDLLMAEAVRRGCTVMHLDVRADNDVAMALYRSRSFTSGPIRSDYYGPGTDSVVMSRPLHGSGTNTGLHVPVGLPIPGTGGGSE